jgi:hypothetical protein
MPLLPRINLRMDSQNRQLSARAQCHVPVACALRRVCQVLCLSRRRANPLRSETCIVTLWLYSCALMNTFTGETKRKAVSSHMADEREKSTQDTPSGWWRPVESARNSVPRQEQRSIANGPSEHIEADVRLGRRSKKTNREILSEVDSYIAQFGRDLTPDEEREVLDISAFE